MFYVGRIRFRTALLSLALVVSGAAAFADCPPGSSQVTRDQGAASGCERLDKQGKAIRIGIWQWQDAAGHVLYRVSYNDWGVEDGVATELNTAGTVIRSQQYTDGKLEGLTTTWWPDGHMREQLSYLDGRMHGVRKRWTYAPRRKDCTRSDETCWAGSEECWVGGERRPHEDCNALYAGVGGSRAPASSR